MNTTLKTVVLTIIALAFAFCAVAAEPTEKPYLKKPAKTSVKKADMTNVVNVNTATAEELQTLNGIGAKKAENIIKFRTAEGKIKDAADFLKIKGISERILEENGKRIKY